MPAGRFVRVAIPLYYEGHAYRAGTRIRVTIAAPNGAQPVWSFSQTVPAGTAQVSIALSPTMPSSLVLPVVPGVAVPTGTPPCPRRCATSRAGRTCRSPTSPPAEVPAGRQGERSMTAVLVHGAGHTGAVWERTRAAMVHPSLAPDIPGRRDRPADITRLTVGEAADSLAADVAAAGVGDVVLVGHSVAGILLPAVAARLGRRVRHLVFVAGIAAPDGEPPVGIFLPGRGEMVERRLAQLRAGHAGRTLEQLDSASGQAADSLNLSAQPMSWAGVPPELGRTFIRCLRDPIQPRDLQDRFIRNCGAGRVLDIDSGHTPAIDAPEELARLLDAILDAEEARPGLDDIDVGAGAAADRRP